MSERFSLMMFKDLIPSKERIQEAESYHDPLLGWKPKFNTTFGERERVIYYNDSIMSTFGDSFTYCDDVNDSQTWEFYLSKLMHRNIYNFGVGGYGTGQAYLRFKEDFPKVKTKIVTLGLIQENINRVVNIYRPFYFPNCLTQLTKPKFLLKDGKLAFIPDPIQNSSNLYELSNPSFIKEMGQYDYWYNSKYVIHFTFPYSKIYFNKLFWHELFHGKYYENLWKNKEDVKIMNKIFDNFVSEAKSQNSIPIIMILPSKYDVVNNQTGYGTEVILKHCKEKGYLCYDANSALSKSTQNNSGILF